MRQYILTLFIKTFHQIVILTLLCTPIEYKELAFYYICSETDRIIFNCVYYYKK